MIKLLTRLLPVLFLPPFCSSLFAAEGRIPISEATTIATEGSYVVTQNFTVTSTAITINVSHVTIDMDGHTITCNSTSADIITNGTTNSNDIHIRNGKLVGGQYGVKLVASGGGEFSVKNVSLMQGSLGSPSGIWIEGGASVSTGAKVRVEGNILSGISGDDITLKNVTVGVVSDNVISNYVENAAIKLDNARNMVVSSNSIYDGDFGIYLLNSYGNHLLENRISGNGSEGILLDHSHSNTIARNTSSGNASGIYLANSNENVISNNNCADNDLTGIFLQSDDSRNSIRDNQISGSLNLDGILIMGATSLSNVIEGNWLFGNSRNGLNISSGSARNIYSRNRTSDNLSGGLSVIAGNRNVGDNYCGEIPGPC